MKNLFQIVDTWFPRILLFLMVLINLGIAANTIYHIANDAIHSAIPCIIVGVLFLWLTILTCKKL